MRKLLYLTVAVSMLLMLIVGATPTMAGTPICQTPTTLFISPTSKNVGDGNFTLTVNGNNFASGAVVRFNGSARTTPYVGSTQLIALIPASDLLTAGTFNITVLNPGMGSCESNAQTFTVNNPVPTTTSISPTSKNVGGAGFTLTVNGTNFILGIHGTWVRFNGLVMPTTFVSPTELRADIPASDLTAAGTFNITVYTPGPGGGESNGQTFTVNNPNPVPTTTFISPTSKNVGDGTFTLTVNGTNFVPASVVRFNGLDRQTTFVNSTQLTATILDTDLGWAGTLNITVFNPAPGGGTSNAQTFTVNPVPITNNPVPTTTFISPTSKNVGDGTFTLTVNGTNFVPASVVRFNGLDRQTTFVNSTQLTATILDTDLGWAGTLNITVFNPAPGGGTSNAQTFTVNPVPITNNPVPTTTFISPTSKNVGDAGFTLTVNGANFISTSAVRFNGSDRTTTYFSSTQLTASIPASDLTAAGTFNITVFNPAPGGGTSNAQTFTVNPAPVTNNPLPATTGISPASKNVGDGTFTLTVNGTNFVPASVVRFNGLDRQTTFVNSTQLTATIYDTDLGWAKTFNITVFNPAPVGGTSNAQTFTVNPVPITNNPLPATTGISPRSKNLGDPGFTLTVNGTNFVPASVVRFNGSDSHTTYLSSTQLEATIYDTDLTAAGTYDITVFNPAPGGGTSNAQTFTLNNLATVASGKTNIGVIVGPIVAVIVLVLAAYWFLRIRKPPTPKEGPKKT